MLGTGYRFNLNVTQLGQFRNTTGDPFSTDFHQGSRARVEIHGVIFKQQIELQIGDRWPSRIKGKFGLF
ncbi:Uncharacterised protein [Vibrio cholerae]|uniref:Uncharacterized protein n=1 Tax=Vibrio cholerae TaxID=666 RepID=A0A655YGQ9_VIBCL|nr:Uncharacterised protein [Vibrio cholerae]CSC39511.1 Uncharacterised protein [Vibrio cholerae]CSD01358.1 Uncharacterised protein [Vibrio cholerae]CSI65069.1 Uncharacterised protein [Vibrio cholerae]